MYLLHDSRAKDASRIPPPTLAPPGVDTRTQQCKHSHTSDAALRGHGGANGSLAKHGCPHMHNITCPHETARAPSAVRWGACHTASPRRGR